MDIDVDNLLNKWRQGDQQAAENLHRRYAQRLCRLADRRVAGTLKRRFDAEDAVQSAFRTFFRRAANGQYQVDHSGEIWNLLLKITLNKIRHKAERENAAKRNVRAEFHPASDGFAAEVLAHEPTPDEAVELEDELAQVLQDLGEDDPEIVRFALEGFSTSEIAERACCSRWTVRRVLNRVGGQLEKRLAEVNST